MPRREMPRTEFLQIRMTPDDLERMRRVADDEHLDLSTWARRTLLKAVDLVNPAVPVRRVAEPSPETAGKGKRRS